jgi:hypothetical protein
MTGEDLLVFPSLNFFPKALTTAMLRTATSVVYKWIEK